MASVNTPPSANATAPDAHTGITHLDVRPILASGSDPLEQILAVLGPIPHGDALVLTVPFRPTPLLTLLMGQGHGVTLRAQGPKLFAVVVVSGQHLAPVDLTDLEPPEPLEIVLRSAASLPVDTTALYWLPRYPRMLMPLLAARPVSWAIHELNDGAALLHLRGQ